MLELDRRDFFRLAGSGLVVAVAAEDASAQRESMPESVAAWLHIAEDGTVSVYTGKAEVGQNIRTSLAQAVAEELHVPVGSIRMVMADTDLTPYDAGTFGSRSTPFMSPQLRKAGAAAREMLLDLAAKQWSADKSRLTAADGRVSNPATGASLTYGQLTKGQKLLKNIPAAVGLTPAREWQAGGKSLPKVNGRDFVTGKHKFASDLTLPDMLHGRMVRPASYGASLASVDASKAESMPGVTVVREGNFLGVAAPTEQAASRAAAAIKADWKAAQLPNDREIFDYLKKNAGQGQSQAATGSMEEGLRAADIKHEAAYTVAYIAHVPLEPRAAVAEWKDGKVTVWTGTQRPFGVRSELAAAFSIPEDRVRVIMPDTGSGYGGKHAGDAALEAARLAKAAAKPVRVVWSREEEFTWAYFRPAGVMEVRSGVRKDGSVTAWEFHNYNSGGAGIRTFYAIPNQRIEFHPVKSPLRQGSYRALAATANHFARETHMDELAALVGMDPLEFRLKNLKDERLRAVFQAAAERFQWGRKPGAGRGYGIAGGFEKLGYVATCAEVEVGSEGVKTLRAVTAFECGPVVNPDHIRNQIEGCVMMGLGGALFEAIRFENGKIRNARLSRYRVPRFSDVPKLETVLLDRKDILPPGGAGETPIVGIAPAIGNAIFQATGKRLRSLPFTL